MWRALLLSIVLSPAHAEVRGLEPASAQPAETQRSPLLKFWAPSIAALSLASALDAHSSWGKCCEANPLLPSSNGRFGPGAAGVKAGALGAQLLVQSWAVRRWPRIARPLAVVNFATAGLLTGVAIRNYGLPGPARR